MDSQKKYDKDYYDSHLGEVYERNEIWDKHFERIADRIINEINPKTVLDVGCAKGFLVEKLRDRGVEAYGIDISEYAISSVREDIKPYCKVASIAEPLEEKYDLVVCIEVLEHLSTEDLYNACRNLTKCTNDVLFSSTPFDYNEESHINVKPVEYWAGQFLHCGFRHDLEYDASYISIQSMRFRRGISSLENLFDEYERMLFRKQQELVPLRYNYELAQERIRVLDLGNIKHGQELDTIKAECEVSLQRQKEKITQRYQKILEWKTEELEKAVQRNIALRNKNNWLMDEIGSYDKQIRHLIAESLFYQQRVLDIKKEYEESTCWKITAPLRKIVQMFRKA